MSTFENKILLVEDEPNLAFNLQLNLKSEGYQVYHAKNGEEAIDLFSQQGPFDLLLLDVMIPAPDGFTVAKTIRGIDKKVGIIMLTARASDADRLIGLELGADDYICKPFNLKELLLKVKRAMSRSQFIKEPQETAQPLLKSGPFSLETEALKLESPLGEFDLTALEADILREFMLNKNRVLSREYLLDSVWGMKGKQETRTVDNFIARLRKYLEQDPTNPQILESVRGRGYRFNSAEDE